MEKTKEYWLAKWVEVHLLPFVPKGNSERKEWEERRKLIVEEERPLLPGY